METTVLNRPKLIAVIKSSGIKSPVEWIDLEAKRCRTQAGYEADIDEFEFIDSRDYDALRGEYAGRAMQAILGAMIINPSVADQLEAQIRKSGYDFSMPETIAVSSVRHADALINELKRPKDYKEMFGL